MNKTIEEQAAAFVAESEDWWLLDREGNWTPAFDMEQALEWVSSKPSKDKKYISLKLGPLSEYNLSVSKKMKEALI